jgi:hypothetical protein
MFLLFILSQTHRIKMNQNGINEINPHQDLQGLEKASPNLPDLAGHVAAVTFSSQDSGQFRLLAMAPRNAMGLSHMLKLWDMRADLVSSRLLRHRTSKLSLSTLLEKENGEPGSNMEQQQ